VAAGTASRIPAQGPALTPVLPPPLPRSFFARPSPAVARDLLGRLLVRLDGDEGLIARIVETEAYQEDDPASHSFGGPRGRNVVMFGPPGHLYVYFTYGMHFCMNVVTGSNGEGSAVLLRAAEARDGLEAMWTRRGGVPERLLCAGPARLAQAFGVARWANGKDLVGGGELWVAAGEPVADEGVTVGPRVGIRRAVDVPWRFALTGSPFVSPGPRPTAMRSANRAPRPPR
jgi:DNA-3-methyladenine glycosylase